MNDRATPETSQVLGMLAQDSVPKIQHLTPEAARQLFDRMAPMLDLPKAPLAAEEDIRLIGKGGALPARLFRPQDAASPAPLILFLHGGGFVIGSVRSYAHLCGHIAAETGAVVLSLDYRLAPEHVFPAAVEDCLSALAFVREAADRLGIDPARIFVAGDSAGGNLAAVTALADRDGDAGAPALAGQILAYPVTDMLHEHPSRETFAEGLFLENETMRWFAGHYLPEKTDRGDWRASPLHANSHQALPPALLLIAGLDPLSDEGRAYGGRLRAAGVPTETEEFPGLIHGFLSMGAVIPEARQAIERIARFVRQRCQHS